MKSSISICITTLCFSCLLLLLVLPTPVQSANFLREGFSSNMGNDFRAEMKLEDGELTNGMTREMHLMKEAQWELQPVNFDRVFQNALQGDNNNSHYNNNLKRHVQSFFKEPVKFKLTSRKGKYGLRAMGQLPSSGKRLRAFWRQPGVQLQTKSSASDALSMSYDQAVQNRLAALEIEVQLPPMEKKSSSNTKLPSVIFTIAVEPGGMNTKAVVPRGPASIKILPEGRGSDKDPIGLSDSGVALAFMSVPMRSGLVDHGWAKGRAIFRQGRTL